MRKIGLIYLQLRENGRSHAKRCYRGETGTIDEATSYSRKALTNVQEERLIIHINKLSDRGLSPIPQIVKNLTVG
jgi:hypothetical protein